MTATAGAGHFGHKTFRHQDTSAQGVATGGIWVFIPPKSAQVNFLWGKNDVRTAIQQFYTPQKPLYPPKRISGYAPASAPTLSRITGGAVFCRNHPGSKVSRLFVDLMPKCLVPRFLAKKCLETVLKCLMRVRSVLVPKFLVAEVSGNRHSNENMKN